MRFSPKVMIWFVLSILFLAACTAGSYQAIPTAERTIVERENIPIESTHSINGWNQLLPFDGIKPVYDPQFIPPEEANLQGSELIMGVAWEGEAKAYPVTVLRRREMVNDEMTGVPYLVSW